MKKSAKNNSSNHPLVIQQLVVKAPQRRPYDVGDWRTALRAADIGRVKQLYDLFSDIMIDGLLSDAVQKRIDAVTNSELTFQGPDGETVEEIAKLMDSTAWETLLSEIAKTRIYGRAGAEIRFDNGVFICDPIPPKHINLDKKCILINDSDDSGPSYEGNDQLLILGHPRDFGLLLKAAPYAVYKRGGFGDWSQWLELFGMPRRIGKYNTYDPESRRLLEEAFEKAGSAPWVVIPKEAEVDTQESSSGSGTSYDEFRKACNEEILITILGQTLTTVQGDKGARSLGEVHKEVEEGKNRSDLRFVQRVLNQHVLPFLEFRGFPVSGGRFIFPKVAEQLSVSDIVQLSSIMDIPQSYLHEKYSIPTPKDGEPIARSVATGFNDDFDLSPGEEVEKVENSDRSFFRRLRDFFAGAPQAGASNGNPHISLTDDSSTTMEDRLIASVASGSTLTFSPELFRFISENLLKAVRGAFKRSLNNADTSFAYGLRDDAFITSLEMNLFHFSAGKTLAEVQALNEAFRTSSSYGDFEKRAREICGNFNRTWQRTEYETAVLTAESASNYHRLKSKTQLFPYWRYVTAGDDRVRSEHRALNGIILRHDDKLWDKIYPPNGWKCRCRVAPLMLHEAQGVDIKAMRETVKTYFGSTDWSNAKAQGWDGNRAKEDVIFSKNQQYIRKQPGKAAKELLKLYHYDYGLPSLAKCIEAASVPMPVYTGSPQDWKNSHQILRDYLGRSLIISDKVFKFHTTGKHESRTLLLSAVPEALNTPDEVWLNNYDKGSNKFTNLNFIKFYEGKAINVVCEIKNGIVEVNTWFEVELNPSSRASSRAARPIDPRWRYRRGLLITRK